MSLGPTDSFVLVSASVSNLMTNTQYFYQLVATNRNGVRLSAPTSFTTPVLIPLASYGFQSGNRFFVSFSIPQNGYYQLQSSSNLVDWSTILNYGLNTSLVSYSMADPRSATNAARFYRVLGP